jgi:hypothetical protein
MFGSPIWALLLLSIVMSTTLRLDSNAFWVHTSPTPLRSYSIRIAHYIVVVNLSTAFSILLVFIMMSFESVLWQPSWGPLSSNSYRLLPCKWGPFAVFSHYAECMGSLTHLFSGPFLPMSCGNVSCSLSPTPASQW